MQSKKHGDKGKKDIPPKQNGIHASALEQSITQISDSIGQQALARCPSPPPTLPIGHVASAQILHLFEYWTLLPMQHRASNLRCTRKVTLPQCMSGSIWLEWGMVMESILCKTLSLVLSHALTAELVMMSRVIEAELSLSYQLYTVSSTHFKTDHLTK